MRLDEIAVLNAAQQRVVNPSSAIVIEGPIGRQGPEGERGPAGPVGPRGEPGLDGRDGRDGTDGHDAPLKVRSEVRRDAAGRIAEIADVYADGTERLHEVRRGKSGRVTEIVAVT